MSAPAIEAAVRPAPSGPQVMRESAAALSDPLLAEAVEKFLTAHEAASGAWERARLTDADGWGAIPAEVERLDAEAEARWQTVAAGHAMGLFVSGDVLDAGSSYTGRRRRVVQAAVVQSGPVDWSRGRS